MLYLCGFVAVVFLSTPSVWRATGITILKVAGEAISIHALRVEGDLYIYADVDIITGISIHALRVEGDGTLQHVQLVETDFYPRPPCGGRLRCK